MNTNGRSYGPVTSSRGPNTSPRRNLARALLGGLCLFTSLLVLSGCARPKDGAPRRPPELSEPEAETIAREKMSGAGFTNVTIVHSSREEGSYWCVPVRAKGEGTLSFTQVLPARSLSRSTAEAIARRNATENLGVRDAIAGPSTLVAGWFWHVLLAYGESPGQSTLFIISAEDGRVMRNIPGL